MLAYNAVAALFSMYCFWQSVNVMRRLPIKSGDCDLFARDATFRSVITLFYLSKYPEFLDTVFLIVRAKPVSWLHYIHHIGAPINMGLGAMYGNEMTWIFVLLNSFIHSIMYSYYGAALAGVRLSFLRPVITSGQILQFITGFSMLWSYKNVPCFGSSPKWMTSWYFTWAYVGTVLFFFGWFFLKNYILKSKKKKKAA